jgi:molybdopterin converting factor small subunit
MKLIMKYLVSVRDMTGKRSEEIDFSRGSTLQDIARWLSENYEIHIPDPLLMATLNGRGWNQYPEGLATKLNDGDTICIFSLVSGG